MRRGCATVPFAKKCQRHGRNCGAGVAADRAFCKKSLKARSKWRGGVRYRPCLLQKTPKARSKLQGGGHIRPCLFQKNAKSTVEIAGRRAYPTVPFAKNGQRHGQNCGAEGATDRAFCKKTPKARSKLECRGHGRPCLLQKKCQRHGQSPPAPVRSRLRRRFINKERRLRGAV